MLPPGQMITHLRPHLPLQVSQFNARDAHTERNSKEKQKDTYKR